MKPSPSEARHRKEIKQLTKERQEWARRAKVEEVLKNAALAEVVEWKARFDKLLSAQGKAEQMTLVGAFGISSDATKSIEREGWDCAECGHRHTGRTYANICIGCPCQAIPALASPAPAGKDEQP